MTNNQLHRKYLTLQEAVDNVLGSTGSEEKDIVVLPPGRVMLTPLMQKKMM